MAEVAQVIRHIREHVVAESADSDPTQTAGMPDRARLVLNALRSLRNDPRDLSLRDLLLEIHNLIPDRAGQASFRRAMVNVRDSEERTPWLAIHEWVARGRETRDEVFEEDE